jgi:hypothetical protein
MIGEEKGLNPLGAFGVALEVVAKLVGWNPVALGMDSNDTEKGPEAADPEKGEPTTGEAMGEAGEKKFPDPLNEEE